MRRWLPHVHFGGTSGECISDETEGGREGHYIDVCWLGYMVGVSFTSIYAERRRAERARKRYEGIGQ